LIIARGQAFKRWLHWRLGVGSNPKGARDEQ
jgi:hypothetical protein